MAEKKLFRLKAGGATMGTGLDSIFLNASNPLMNILESEEDLATDEPMKYEEYKGPRPAYLMKGFRGTAGTVMTGIMNPPGQDTGVQPPLPTTPEQAAEAQLISGNFTAGDLEKQAEHFAKLAEGFKKRAADAKAAEAEQRKAADKKLKEQAKAEKAAGGGKDQAAADPANAEGNTGAGDDPDLEGMTKDQIIEFLDSKEVDHTGRKTKAQLIEAWEDHKANQGGE